MKTSVDRYANSEVNFLLQRLDKGMDQVHMHAAGAPHHRGQVGLDQRRENDGALAVGDAGFVDAAHGVVGLFQRVDEGQPDLAEAQFELRQHRMPECLGRDAGAVGNEKDRAFGSRQVWGDDVA